MYLHFPLVSFPTQALVAKSKASRRVLERKQASVTFTQTRSSQPRTKQTTISAFFSSQTDDKENSRLSPFIPKCKEKGISLAASPVKILALPQMEEGRKESFSTEVGTARAAPRCPAPSPLPDSSVLEGESCGTSEASCGVGEDSCFFSFTQDSEGNRIIAHRNASDLFAGETVSVSSKRGGRLLPEETIGLDFQPRLGANEKKKPHPSSSINSFTDFTETENTNPTLRRDSTCAAGFYPSPQRSARAQPLRERNHNVGAGSAQEGRGSPCRELFTQDSQGNRVIAHRAQTLPSPSKGCSGNGSLSEAEEHKLDTCYDLLFTQDSEGNRVIKHWCCH
ncbi:PREDICTED: aurora kinase A and ninein-interacting protein-like [Calidris pugnax]|uniref:aurora kinase A and ninein-interacting protein-like n=1 Tax=Calidris pugnax TaxID=198806 RepID=UPI00071E52AF|nr:PREDICTED: aurora kinase A and ninein-interacting protein-like [Calidris pugnax]